MGFATVFNFFAILHIKHSKYWKSETTVLYSLFSYKWCFFQFASKIDFKRISKHAALFDRAREGKQQKNGGATRYLY